MKKINGIEIEAIKAIYGNDTEVQDAVLVHDEADEYHDGDTIYFGYTLEDFENEADLEPFNWEHGCTVFTIVNGIYMAEEV